MKIHDFRIVDRVLAETEADAPDLVYLGATGQVAFPFVVVRRIAGPGGIYVDACDVIDADGASLGIWERKFELDGESKPRTIVTEIRECRFAESGTYTLQYSVFDDVVGNFPFRVVQQESPAAGIVPGPLDAALAKSTIVWLRLQDTAEPVGDSPAYRGGKDWPIWYGYENGRIYVLVGEGEQRVPGLESAGHVRLLARSKDKRSQIADVECAVEVLPKDANWDRIARDLLLGRRLNLRDGDAAVERWKRAGDIVALTPIAPPVEP